MHGVTRSVSWVSCALLCLSAAGAEDNWREPSAAVRQRIWFDGRELQTDLTDVVIQLRLPPALIQESEGGGRGLSVRGAEDGRELAFHLRHLDPNDGVVFDVRVPVVHGGRVEEAIHVYAVDGSAASVTTPLDSGRVLDAGTIDDFYPMLTD